MTIETGATVRTLTELRALDGSLIPEHSRCLVIGYAGDKLVLECHDRETDTVATVEANVWEVRK